jgi:hypothetical protein
MAVLLPFLRRRAHDGQLVVTSKGHLARHLQETVGDVIINTGAETLWTCEIKAEQRATGNFFIETWSNKNLSDRASHAERGSNRGWLDKLRADILLYYFIDADELYAINLFRLQQWAFTAGPRGGGCLERYREVRQSRYQQANDTWGRLVPIEDIRREVGFRKISPRRIELPGNGADAMEPTLGLELRERQLPLLF